MPTGGGLSTTGVGWAVACWLFTVVLVEHPMMQAAPKQIMKTNTFIPERSLRRPQSEVKSAGIALTLARPAVDIVAAKSPLPADPKCGEIAPAQHSVDRCVVNPEIARELGDR